MDDEAFAWVAHARPLAVTVVGTQTEWLRAAFERDPDVRATFVDPASYVAALPPRWRKARRVDLRSLGAARGAGHSGAVLRASLRYAVAVGERRHRRTAFD